MTGPDPLTGLAQTVQRIDQSVQELSRAVQGDPVADVPSIRHAVKAVADNVKVETERMCRRLDELEEARMREKAHLEGVMTVIKWLGGSSLAALVGLIVMLIKQFGGGA
ncbi:MULTISPECIES: hypothetical protein [unclassified Deinococcus]|uniref:hypothetical protein n=1 Tax=unclassified Deinococcus TaxID=2623546 RepID=UPI001E3FC9EE|nr:MULTISPECIES: hypothetical protein [unclassified Deinococcus]MCD0155887.1 hypothetical protein [Deinococcus sp. 6GRE01]MCD0160048.1 hypothetical protein [Deinococcus sp. 6YEL10]